MSRDRLSVEFLEKNPTTLSGWLGLNERGGKGDEKFKAE
jgi:hypothetical protein